ncbi:MAG TPA: LuxR C-terminal-related transcriptional regulator [Microbacteriaceae bacterium]|nr:LuxR C-terminal-related transcriptional regulator [Microbacteriaceae bacterium]
MSPAASALPDELAAAVARGDVDRIGGVVNANLWVLVQSHWALLKSALDLLPEDFLEANPTLALVKGFGSSVFLEGGGVNERATTMMQSGDGTGMPDQVLDAILLQEMLGHRLRGDFAAAKDVGSRLRTRVERVDEHGRRPIHDMVAFYLLHVGITEALAGDLEQSLRDFANVRSLRAKTGNELAEYDAALKSALVHAALGRLVEAERSLRRAGTPPELSEPFASQIAATETAARALIAVDRLGPDAPELVRSALEQNADAEMWPFALLASTRWAIVTGDLVGAIDEVDQVAASRHAPPESLLGLVVATTRAQALAIMGEFGAALRALESEGVGEGPAPTVVRTRVALYTEGPEAALVAARQLVVRPGLGPSARAETMLLAAWAQVRLLGAPDGATAGPLGALVAREGLWRVLQLVPERVVAALPGLEQAPAFERRLAHHDPSTSVRLTANELEVLELLAGPDSLPTIARRRFVSPNTIKTQVASIYRGLGVHGRREAVAEATRRGILGHSET